MTDALARGARHVRTGFVIRTLDGAGMNGNPTKYHCYRLCRAASTASGIPFGTRGDVQPDPWKLMLWMGHKRIDETMLYVNAFPRLIVGRSRRSSSRRSTATTTGSSSHRDARRPRAPFGAAAAAGSLPRESA